MVLAAQVAKLGTENERRAALRELRLRLCREDLIEFCKRVDPKAVEQYRAAHLRQIADKLEAVERGEIKRLFITTPPKHWKSSLVSEKFPAWYLSQHPDQSVILATHTISLSEGFSRNVRDMIITNEMYHELFPAVRVRDDVAGVSEWLLSGGYRSSCRAVGTGGAITGKGGQLIIIDDPISDEKVAFSSTQRNAVWTWYQNTLRDRLEPNGAMVLVMSRWHKDDLAGRLLKASASGQGEKWETLHLPATDKDGNALWPERWPVNELEKIKRGIGTRAWNAKFMGNPRDVDEMLLDSTKLKMLDLAAVPELVSIVRRWDLAFSEKQGADYLAGAKVGKDAVGNFYILDIKRLRGRWPKNKPEIVRIAQDVDPPNVICAIESNGTQLGYFQDIQADKQMANRIVKEDKPEGSKEMRASMWGSRLDDGLIHCVRGPWNGEFFDECDDFPNSDHDDCVDAVSGAYAILSKGRAILLA